MSQQWRAKHRAENLLHGTLESLFRYPPAERLIKPNGCLCSLDKVKHGLTHLTPEERKAVLMFRFGYPYEQIATEMNVSVEAVRAHLRRGFSTLKTSATETQQE